MPESTLEQLLGSLVLALQNKELKSKQTAFYQHFEDLEKAKEMAAWETIANFINEKTNDSLTPKVTSNMFQRAKAKANRMQKRVGIVSQKSLVTHQPIENKISNNGETEQPQKKDSGYSNAEWELVGISSQRLIDDLNEYGLSPEEVRSWGCANDVGRRKKLTELVRKLQKGK